MIVASSSTAPGTAAAALRRLAGPARFVAAEVALFVTLYLGYLSVRSVSVGSRDEAVANARDLIALEGVAGVDHEAGLQQAVGAFHGAFSAYYMLGFGPVVFATLVWLAVRRRDLYRRLRTALLVSIAIATVGYVLFPAAPPRMVPELGIADTVGLSGSHDEGSFGGVRFNPYAAMPSMHVGWSLLVGVFGYRAARRRITRSLFVAHPAMMTVTVTATGNHYFLDSAAGALVALTGLGVLALAARRRALPAAAAARPAPALRAAAALVAATPAAAARRLGALVAAPPADRGWRWSAIRAGPRG